ncbi:MAG: energy-coupling factor transporter transmembrane protein EcfT, partial [bacterium]
MYNWILKKDEYVPQKDRDLFIDRNILSMISKISRIKNQRRDSSLLFYRLHPIVKFITTIVLVLA